MEINRKTITRTLKLLLVVLAFTFTSNMDAGNKKKRKNQRPTPPTRQHKPGSKNPCKVPLTGGLGVLVLGAAAFGVKKLRS